jgi:ABC-type lipoprotein export system ATPase subunit
MTISFENVMPTPLSSLQHGDDSIWGNTFQLQQGQKVVLNASSGKGKTTFTHTLAGIRNDYTGDLKFDQQTVSAITPEDWAFYRREKISFVFQDLQLFPELTVRENLLLKNGLTKTYTEEELKDLLRILGIPEKWDAPCKLLSMGQQQRVAIVRALAQPFEWMILDEPFSHLDKVNTALCLDLINKRCDELGAGFILTTLGDYHDFTFDKELKL